MRRVH